MQLSGSHVLITGASRGIGEALARDAARRGASVTLVARSADSIDALAADIGGRSVPADLMDPAQLGGLVQRVEERAGAPVDVLVNCAGVDNPASMLELDAHSLAETVLVNLLAPAELIRQALPGMVERGRGHVVNVSSGFSTVVVPGLAPYSATKAALSHFTGGLNTELRDTGVETTLVEPGPVRTSMYGRLQRSLSNDALQRMLRLQLTAEVEPEQVAKAALDKVESGGGHVVLPSRMSPVMAVTWLPRRVGELAIAGVRRR
jgi:uncharacterized protein